MRQFAQAGVLPVFLLETRAAAQGLPLIYLSAGVHGDVLSAARALIARSRRGPVSGPALAGGAWAGGARHHPAWA